MTYISFSEEQRRKRLVHARFTIDIAADKDDVKKYDLPPDPGLELQHQIINAIARSPFFAAAEISVTPIRPEAGPKPIKAKPQ